MKEQALTRESSHLVATPLRMVEFDRLFERMEKIYNEIARRAFELFEARGYEHGRDLEDWFRAERELLLSVPIHLSEAEDTFTLRADVPGFAADELEISLEPQRLTISGKHETREEPQGEKTLYSEQRADQILRVIDLPAEVDPEKTVSTLKDGVLELRMPKTAAARKVKIQTRAA